MKRTQSLPAAWCALAALSSTLVLGGQEIGVPRGKGIGAVIRSYRAPRFAPIDLTNSSRLEALTRDGKIYLSLEDAIALALENNIDIATVRYDPFIAQQDLKRAQSGGLVRGVPTTIYQGPSSATQVSQNSIISTGVTNTVGSGLSQLGPAIPTLDPVLSGSLLRTHTTFISPNVFQIGTTALQTNATQFSVSLAKNFITGGSATLSLSNNLIYQNTYLNDINPQRNARLDLTVFQPLLQGFAPAVNNRDIRIARNEVKTANTVFEQQVISTVSNVVGLYWDLVSFNESVKYAKQNLALAEQSYNDNKRQVEIGTLAQIEITRAEAEMAARQQDVTVAETNELEQETIIKNTLSRDGVSAAAAAARIVPTDSIQVPEKDEIRPLQELYEEALAHRPELTQSGLTVDNSRIQLQGTKNELLPSLALFVELTNHGLAGDVNTITAPGPNFPAYFPNPVPLFIGGNGTALAQLFNQNFLSYRIGFSLNIPFRNRAAQSDYAHDQMTLREAEISYRQQAKQVKLDVQNAVVTLHQSRAQYETSVRQRILQERTLDAEQKKYKLGASTTLLVIQALRDLAQAQSNEVTAESTYQKARENMEVATGRILSAYHVKIEEARSGKVARPPSAIPAAGQ